MSIIFHACTEETMTTMRRVGHKRWEDGTLCGAAVRSPMYCFDYEYFLTIPKEQQCAVCVVVAFMHKNSTL